MNVLFVCTGNICRSPLAEGVLQAKYHQRAIGGKVDSCGFESYHVGDSPDHRAQQVARLHGIDISNHAARQFRADDFDRFDKIYVMDSSHYQAVMRVARSDSDRGKVDFVRNVIYPDQNMPVKDPYYDDYHAFEIVYDQLNEACEKIADEASTYSTT